MRRPADLLVLCYHAISEDWGTSLAVTPADLQQQVGRLLRRGYVAATFHEAVTDPPAAATLAVTFDDAFASVGRLAAPVLERLGVPATVFVPTGFPSSGRALSWPGIEQWEATPHAAELAPLDWDELAALRRRGWEIGSHTVSHPRLPTLDDEALARELSRSRAVCEQWLGVPCRSIAYPYGAVDVRVVDAARAAGYTAGGALPPGPVGRGALAVPRVGVYARDDRRRLALKTAPAVRRVRRLRAARLSEAMCA